MSISPITTANTVPTKDKLRTRPVSASGFSPRKESKKIPEQADKEKSEALQAIRELQAKGATTEDLSCHICQPSKCFTAYTTLLSHLRSHAGIRKFELHKSNIVFFVERFSYKNQFKWHFIVDYFLFLGPYECQVCRAVFTRQHSLNYHLLIHQNETRFTCNDCGRKFRYGNKWNKNVSH